jgi:2-polyprenyl-3-methyl-5-hydroxy-6-metoxy-1,4-benzoquinol methylase
MQYDPIKKSLGRFFSGPLFMRRTFYSLLDILLLRTWHVRRELKKISRIISGNAVVLDAGSGFGQYTWRMSRMNKNWRIDAVDIDPDHVKDCREFFSRSGLSGRVNFYEGDLTFLSTLETYDFILSVDVMEHIKDDETVFRNFNKALRNGGMLLISTPSDQGGSDVHNEKDRSFIDEHVRDGYSITEITQKLVSAGFVNVNARYTYGKPGSVSWRLSMKYPVRMLNSSYLFFIILPFYYLILFPFMIVLNIFDLKLKHGSGTGLLVTAARKKS